jgi:hypothetical protein
MTSVHRCGFALRPWGFFDTNPAMDVAPPEPACDCAPGECTHDHGHASGHAASHVESRSEHNGH